MHIVRSLFLLTLLASLSSNLRALGAERESERTRVLIVTGGHDFEKTPFFQMFGQDAEISWEAVAHPDAQARFTPEAATKFDVLVLYDMYQPISDEAKTGFLARLKKGQGLVVLHHAIANYQEWPEYAQIIGARYYLKPTVVDGIAKKRSAYKHDVQFRIEVADPNHPVTRGLTSFDIRDETYKWFDVDPNVKPLLTTTEPESNPVIAWAKTYEAARVVSLQLGHDHFAFENPNYRRLVSQAIRWVARKS